MAAVFVRCASSTYSCAYGFFTSILPCFLLIALVSHQGSHRWPTYRKPKEEECYQSVMPQGSVVIYTGDLFHSSAANKTEQKRWCATKTATTAANKQLAYAAKTCICKDSVLSAK